MSLTTTSRVYIHEAIVARLGMGFMADYDAKNHPDLVEILPPSEEIASNLWVVTHVDLNGTEKVQAFLRILKQHATKTNARSSSPSR